MKQNLMNRMPIVLVVAAVLWTGSVALAGHRAHPSPRLAVLDSAQDLERATERLVRTVARETHPRKYRDRAALRSTQDLLFRVRDLEFELERRQINKRRVDRQINLLLVSFDETARAMKRARVSGHAWDRFDRVGRNLGRLERTADRTLFARGHRVGPPARRGSWVEVGARRSVPVGDRGRIDVDFRYRR